MHTTITARHEQPPTRSWPPPFATWSILSIAGIAGVLHLIASAFGGYWFDEAYMLAAGKYHLDWGYADQPPLAPLLAAAMDWLAPESLVVLRLPAVLATAGGIVVAGLIAREFGGDRRAQVLTAGAFATALWVSLAGHWVTPYSIEPVQWMLLTWLLVRWVRLREDRLLLVLGLIAGIAAQTKVQVMLLCAVLLLSVLLAGPRDLLRRPMLWGGVLLAGLIAAPSLIWQATHGWPQLQMGAVAQAENPILYGDRVSTGTQMLAAAGIAGIFLVFYGLWRLLFNDALAQYRFLGVTFLILFVFFIITYGRPYYLGGIYGVIAAAGAVGLQQRRETGRARLKWFAWPAYALSAAAAIAMVWTSTTPGLTGELPTQDVARQVASSYHALPPDIRERTAIVGQSYINAAFIEVQTEKFGLPKTYSPHRGYGYFTLPPEHTDSVLYAGSEVAKLRPYFADVRMVSGGQAKDSDGTKIWLCTGKQASWAQIWSDLKTLG